MNEMLIAVLVALALVMGLAMPASLMVRLQVESDPTVPVRSRSLAIAGLAAAAVVLLVFVGLAPGPQSATFILGGLALLPCLGLIALDRWARAAFIAQRIAQGALVPSGAKEEPAGDRRGGPADDQRQAIDDHDPEAPKGDPRDLRAAGIGRIQSVLSDKTTMLTLFAIACMVATSLPPDALSAWVKNLGMFFAGWALGSLGTWIKASYGNLMKDFRASLTAGEKDAFFGAEYFSYMGIFGGLIGILCRLVERAGLLGQSAEAPAPLLTIPILAGVCCYAGVLAVAGLFRSELGRWVAVGLSLILTVALAVHQVVVGVTATWLLYAFLVWLLASAGSVVNNFILQLNRRPWRAVRASLFMAPLVLFLHHYLRTMDINRGARPALIEQYGYLTVVAVLFIGGLTLITWLDTRYGWCLTEQTPTFNALHNGVLVTAVLTGGLLVTMQLLPAKRDPEGLLGTVEVMVTLFGLMGAIFLFSLRNYAEHRADLPPAVLELPAASQLRWQAALGVWSRAQVLLLATVAGLPWVAYIMEVLV